MKAITLLIGCYYPSSLDDEVKNTYIKKDVSISNLLYERILFEDFLNHASSSGEVLIISAPSFGYYKKQCKKAKIHFKNNKKIHYVEYSTRRYNSHISKTKKLESELLEVTKNYDLINILISEAHLPYLFAVKKMIKKTKNKTYNITLIVPDLPENVNRTKYNFFERLLKKKYVSLSNKLMHSIPDKYVCFTKNIADCFDGKEALISHGVIENNFKELIKCTGYKTFVYSGKLEECNGVSLLIDAFNLVCKIHQDSKLIICGDGPLASYVREKADSNKQIHYMGFLTSKENNNVLRQSNVLLCPRLPSEQEKYCFPSKLVNYSKYNSQIVVFKNLIYEEALKDSVTYCNSVSAESLAESMINALNKPFNLNQRLDFIYSCKTQRIIDFCQSLSTKNR